MRSYFLHKQSRKRRLAARLNGYRGVRLCRFLRKTAFLCLLIFLLLTIYIRHAVPVLSDVAEAEMQNEVQLLLSKSVGEFISPDTDGAYLTLTKDENGKITSAQADASAVNHTRATIASDMISRLKNSGAISVRLPIGCFLGIPPLYAKGPSVPVSGIRCGRFSCRAESDFSVAGINQTLHRLRIIFTVECAITLPFRTIRFPVQCEFLLSETLIVGDVPQAYTEIHRVFDDTGDGITESEIDDIYDFGAALA